MSDSNADGKPGAGVWRLFFMAAALTAALAVVVVLSRAMAPGEGRGGDPPKTVGAGSVEGAKDSGWKKVERLISEQKLQAAADLAGTLREEAAKRGDEAEWTEALVKEVQLRTALHGYETAVRFLKEQPWPQEKLHRDVLQLFYAQSLVTYYQAYSWEINQREKVETKGAIDLKAWTREDLFAEAQRAYLEVFDDRGELGSRAVGSLPHYIEANDYPDEVRGTLRDAVCYLYVDLLSDTSFWTPSETNEVYALDLSQLLGKEEGWWQRGGSEIEALSDPKAHPLEKVCAVLGDLERWHRSRGERAAQLEARLERIRSLHDAFTSDEDRALLRAHLDKTLRGFGDLPWWAVGKALQAQYIEEEKAPDSLVRARACALEGLARHPESVGGRRCLHIVKSIEAPNYDLASMSSDGPQRRSLQVTHKNLGTLRFRAYRLDLRRIIGEARDYNLLPRWDAVKQILESESPVADWRVDLPATPDFREHKTFVEPPMRDPGLYVVAASAKGDFKGAGNRVEALTFMVTDLVLLTRQTGEGGVEATVLDGDSGYPVEGAEVALHRYDWQKGHQRVETKRTKADGVAAFSRGAKEGGNYFLMAVKGEQAAFDPSYLYFYQAPTPAETTSSLIYTDRSIYRPGQKICWKLLGYHGSADRSRYSLLPSTPVTVSLYDLNNQRVAEAAVSTNAFGTASGEFVIPGGRPLGGWSLRSSLGGQAGVQVEEYKRPTFEAKLLDPKAPMRLNRPATLTGQATYYFGLPVVNGKVTWKVTREPVYPWWWTWYGRGGGASTQVVATGVSPLEEDGTFELTFTPKADERDASRSKEISYRYAVTADVTDEGGETRTAARSYRLGFVSVEASLDMPAGFFRQGEEMAIAVRRTDLSGSPREGKGEWRLVALTQPERTLLPSEQPPVEAASTEGADAFKTPGDGLRPRWDLSYAPEAVLHSWSDGGERARGALDHDAEGEAKARFPELQPGAYRIYYETMDDFGETYVTSREFVVAGARTPLALPAFLLAENPSVPVGGTARFFIHSGLPGQPMVLEFYRDGRLTERRRLVAGEAPSLLEVPIGEKERGGFGVRLSILRDHQFMTFQQSLFVPWDDKDLKIEFATFRDKLRPGAAETWRVTVKGPDGDLARAGAAELLAYMYDRSLDLFAAHHPPDPKALYPNRTGTGSYRASLGQVTPSYSEDSGLGGVPYYPSLREDSLTFYSGYGIGGPGMRAYLSGVAISDSMINGLPLQSPAAPMKMAAKEEGKASDKAVGGAKDEPLERNQSLAEAPAEPAQTLRSNFAETAFWEPHLLTNSAGEASIEFTVPDSVTSWNVWVHAVTKDLKSGSAHRETRSVKDLMVRPYVPRFFREGDRAEMKVVVNNASDHEMRGEVVLEIFDPETNASLMEAFGFPSEKPVRMAFSAKAGGGSNVVFPVSVPARIGTAAFKVTASSGDLSDGELRPVPVLPGRMHLVQSRFATLKDKDRRTLTFQDLATNDDPSRIDEQLVVTLDAQLFYGVLAAMPYLVNYPYECTEQTLNRFLSTGILTSLYRNYPAVSKMAEEFSKRDTRLERWDDQDLNRKMALEETPWLQAAQGGADTGHDLIRVLDPRIAEAQREASLAQLVKSQTSIGGFPWWAGGPPSPYMTLYICYGFSKGLEFGVDAPKGVVVRAFSYLHRHYLDECVKEMMERDAGWEFVTFLNYVLSNYPDESWTGGVFTEADRKQMIDFSFKHWKQHSPYLKGYLALTLKRMGRPADARLVFDSVMDSAKTTPDEGTSWAPEDRGWLWYNDTAETHAFALRALMELDPKDPRSDGLVQWIFLNKKLNHWESTRATSEVVYSLAHYLRQTGALGVREEATVTVGPQRTTFVFEPDRYTGKKVQVVVPGDKVDPKTMSTIVVEKETKGMMFASATWHFSTEKLPEKGSGDLFAVERAYFKRETAGDKVVLRPLTDGAPLAVGDEIEVQLSLRARHGAEYVHLRDPRPSGCEPVSLNSGYKWDLGLARYEEVRDSGTNFFMEWLPQGEYTLKYRLRVAMAGTFRVSPATVQSMYAPEFAAYSAGAVIRAKP